MAVQSRAELSRGSYRFLESSRGEDLHWSVNRGAAALRSISFLAQTWFLDSAPGPTRARPLLGSMAGRWSFS